MQRMQRKFGVFLPRTPNEADVESMLNDFNDSDSMLAKIEDAAKAWRDSWTSILHHQLTTSEQLYTLYKPLGAKSDSVTAHVPVETLPSTLQRAEALQTAFAELKADMTEELKDIDNKLILPAKFARDSLKPMKKAIKKREDRKLDYERYQSRVDALQKKASRSDRDNTALVKHEADLARSTHDYQLADEGLRSALPKLNAATFSLLPYLLANQIVLQNNLIGNLYTVFHHYSQDYGFPDPPPELDEVVPVWDAAFTPLRKEIEAGYLLKDGKAIHQPMKQADQGSSVTGYGIRNKVIPNRRASSNTTVPTKTGTATSPQPGFRLPPPAESGAPPPLNLASKPSLASLNATKPKMGGTSPGLSPSSADLRRTSTASSTGTNGHEDYFGRPQIPSATSASSVRPVSPNPAAGKKKPPPPPPKKIGSFHGEFVTAMYDFDGQGEGDLVFREGDRIKVVKKTNSSQDWWEGELRGRKGSFPANYCR